MSGAGESGKASSKGVEVSPEYFPVVATLHRFREVLLPTCDAYEIENLRRAGYSAFIRGIISCRKLAKSAGDHPAHARLKDSLCSAQCACPAEVGSWIRCMQSDNRESCALSSKRSVEMCVNTHVEGMLLHTDAERFEVQTYD